MILCSITEEADHGLCPQGQDIRKSMTSMAFQLLFSVDAAQQAGQESTAYTFLNRYSVTQMQNHLCVVMGTLP